MFKTNFINFYSIVKMFAQNKEDRKRVEKALDTSGFPSTKVIIFHSFTGRHVCSVNFFHMHNGLQCC